MSAALYDARGFYSGTTQITGTVSVPLSSYATALPFKYDILAPYIPLPEPSTVVLAAVAVGLLAVRGLSRARRPVVRAVRRKAA